MASILKTIFTTSTAQLAKLVMSVCEALVEMFTFLNNKRKDEKEKEHVSDKEKFDKAVDKAVDKGTIDDLLDLKR